MLRIATGGVLRKRLLPVRLLGTHEHRAMLTANRADLQPINVRLPSALRDALAACGDAEGEPISVIVRRACRQYIEREGIQA